MMTKQKIIAIIGAIGLAAIFVIAYFVLISPEPKEKPEPVRPVDETKAIPIAGTLEETVATLNTSQALLLFLNEYFTVEERPGLVAYSPEEFFEKRKGASYDFAVFAAHVLRQNRFEAGVIRFNYLTDGQERTHFVAVFREDKPKYLTVTDVGVEIFHHGWSSAELIKAEEQRLGVKALEYAYFPANVTDLTEPTAGHQWQEVK